MSHVAIGMISFKHVESSTSFLPHTEYTLQKTRDHICQFCSGGVPVVFRPILRNCIVVALSEAAVHPPHVIALIYVRLVVTVGIGRDEKGNYHWWIFQNSLGEEEERFAGVGSLDKQSAFCFSEWTHAFVHQKYERLQR